MMGGGWESEKERTQAAGLGPRDPRVWILARSSGKWHRLGASRMPKADALPGEQVLCGWKVTRDVPLVYVEDGEPTECVTCNREALNKARNPTR